MSEPTAVAAPSAAPEAPAPIEIPRSGTPEYAEWRHHGSLPEKSQPKPAESAPADQEKAPKADANASPAPKQENNGKPKTERRFQELLSERNQLKAELEALKAPKPSAETQTKPQHQPQQQHTRPKPTIGGNGPDGKPYADYEAFVEDLSDWKAEQRWAQQMREEQQKASLKEVESRVQQAKSRYENFDEISRPFVKQFVEDAAIPMAIKVMVSESDCWPDLVYTIGSDSAEMAKFLEMAKTKPGQALRYVAKVEALIQEELSKGAAAGRNASGQFTKAEPTTPAKRGPESAPEPPIQIGHRGTGPVDDTERAIQTGDFRTFKKAEDRKELARRRGV